MGIKWIVFETIQNTRNSCIAVKESLYVIKHVDFHKTFASIFSAYTTSILKIHSYTKYKKKPNIRQQL